MRVLKVYLGYKFVRVQRHKRSDARHHLVTWQLKPECGSQVRAYALRQTGLQEAELQARLWVPHHTWAGVELFRLSIDLKGFYLKTGQFLGARSDFIPEPICRQLIKLQDQACRPFMHDLCT